MPWKKSALLCMDETPDNAKAFRAVCAEMAATYEAKNADYGNSFHTTFQEEGLAAARIRLTDKLSRFKAITRSGRQRVFNESLEDTLLDMACYAIMTVLEIRR